MSAFDSHQVAQRAEQFRWILAAFFVLLLGAFFKAQVLDRAKYVKQSEETRLRELPLATLRGLILDRHGNAIAENVPGYSIKLFAETDTGLRRVIEQIRQLVPIDSIDTDRVVKTWKARKYQRYRPVVVFASGSDSTVAVLEEHRAALPGLVIQNEPRRVYPAGPAVAHLVGYLGEVDSLELERRQAEGLESGDIVGKDGLEGEYDSTLRGKRGRRFVEVTPRGQVFKSAGLLAVDVPVPGAVMQTTIDLPLQRFIDSLWRTDLPDKSGAVVAMTPRGEILAYVSYPSFDPNAFIAPMDRAAIVDALRNPGQPMFNRAIAARYPPASPWKLATAIMALRRGLVTMDSRMPVACTGGFQYGNRRWGCWIQSEKKGMHGSLTLAEAISTSCDVYFYQLGLLLGKDAMLADGIDMGFNQRTGIDLEKEKASGFPTVQSYINSRGKSTWSNGEILNLSIGQGMNQQTLLMMTSFYAALAGDGIRRAPHLYNSRANAPAVDLRLTPEQLQGLRSALFDVVNKGTAASSGGARFRVAGKTGSGQVTGKKDIAWFIGFAPYEAPKIVIGMVEEEGIHGSYVAPYVAKMVGQYLGGDAVYDAPPTEDLSRTSPPPAAPSGRGLGPIRSRP